jgi:hypothetical protein
MSNQKRDKQTVFFKVAGTRVPPEVLKANVERESERLSRERDAAAATFASLLGRTGSEDRLNLSKAQTKVVRQWAECQLDYYRRRHTEAFEHFLWRRINVDFTPWDPVNWEKIISMAGQLVSDVGKDRAAAFFSELAKIMQEGELGGWRGDELTPIKLLPSVTEPSD